MSRKLKIGLFLAFLCIVIAIIPLVMIKNSDFGGSDNAASQAISEILQVDEYKPWASPVYKPPGGETESLLFCLQAALGAGVFGYGLGVLRERTKNRKDSKSAVNR